MKQHQYENIIDCINLGAPAQANRLITAFNESIKLANDHIAYLQELEKKEKPEDKVVKKKKE